MRVDSSGTRRALIATALLIISFGQTRTADAAGVVGTGSPASCTEAALDAALFGGGSVTFNCGGGAVSVATTATKTVAATTTIDGGGLITIDASTLSLSSTNTFQVDPGVTLTVQNLAIANNPIFGGAAIANGGTVIAQRSTVSGNSMGFGFFGDAGSMTTVTDCTFDGNAQGILTSGTAIASGTTFFNNGTALRVESFAPPGAVTNSTFSDNVIGIVDFSTALKVINCTVTGSTGVGVSASPTLTNTIVAGNPGGNCGSGPITDNGHNLEDGTSCGFSAIGSLSGTPPGFDPGGLADNGGPTQTIALLSTSAAVDGGDDAVCSVPPVSGLDQRGVPRPGAGHSHCSIGAYEFSSVELPTGTPTEAPPDTATPTITPQPTRTATPTPGAMLALQRLIELIHMLPLPPGIVNELTATLRAAVGQIEAGHTTPACNQLNALVNKLSAQQNAGRLTAAQVADLNAAVATIRARLRCS